MTRNEGRAVGGWIQVVGVAMPAADEEAPPEARALTFFGVLVVGLELDADGPTPASLSDRLPDTLAAAAAAAPPAAAP